MNKPRFRNGERKNSIYIWLFVSYSRNNSNRLIWILFAYCGGKRYLILIGTMPNKCKETWQPIQTFPFYFIRHTSQQKKRKKKVYSPKQDYFLLLISNNVTHESPPLFRLSYPANKSLKPRIRFSLKLYIFQLEFSPSSTSNCFVMHMTSNFGGQAKRNLVFAVFLSLAICLTKSFWKKNTVGLFIKWETGQSLQWNSFCLIDKVG